MIIAPTGFVDAIENENRNYQMLIEVELESGTVLTLDNTHVWSSGFGMDDSITTGPDDLTIGSAIINQAIIVINNMDETFSEYDFARAAVSVQIGLQPDEESSVAYISKGEYTVAKADYNGTLITLTCYDHMAKFDVAYATNLTFPSTALAVVQDACGACGVTLGVSTFDGAATAIPQPPAEGVTYRQMLSWVGQMIGCCWRVNTLGELVPLWYDLSALGQFWDGGTFAYNGASDLDGGTFAYNDGDSADGGTFSGQNAYFAIYSAASQDVAVDDTLVTGVRIRVTNTAEDATQAFTDYTVGTDSYEVIVEGNPLINEDNVSTVLSTLSARLVGMRYRKGNVSHLSDPRLEAGDVFVFTDHKGHAYPMICSETHFAVGEYQNTTSASQTPARNTATRYSEGTRNTVNLFAAMKRERNSREEAVEDLQEQIDTAPGLYMTTQTESGATVYILHNKPTLAASNIVWKMSSTAVGVSTNGGQSYNAGLTADGTAIVQRLYANAITAGIIKSSDYAYTSGTYTTAGMIVDLNSQVIRAKNVAILNNGSLYARRGNIGPWVIADNSIYHNKATLLSKTEGVYVGTDGVSIYSATFDAQVAITSYGFINLYSYGNTANGITMTSVGENRASLYNNAFNLMYDVDSSSPVSTAIVSMGLGTTANPYGDVVVRGYDDSCEVRMTSTQHYASILFSSPSDFAIIRNTYNSTAYNLIRNHNNGNISISASSAGLYLGYENTTFVNFLNGKMVLDSDGFLTILNGRVGTASDSSLFTDLNKGAIAVRYGTYNALQIVADAAGTARIWRRTANNTSFNLISCANNSTAITADGSWTFSNSVATNGNLIATSASGERQICAYGGTTNRIYLYANSDGRVGLYSFRADGTACAILARQNNTSEINAGGTKWTFPIRTDFTSDLYFTDYSNTLRKPVASTSADGGRVAYLQMTSNTQARIGGQNGKAGSAIANRTWTVSSSDIRLKEHIEDTGVTALDALNAIRLRAFDWKSDHDHWKIGMIADEVEKIDPKFAIGGGYDESGAMNIKSIDTFYMMGYLVKAIQELSQEVNRLKGVRA